MASSTRIATSCSMPTVLKRCRPPWLGLTFGSFKTSRTKVLTLFRAVFTALRTPSSPGLGSMKQIAVLDSSRRHPFLLAGWLWFVGTLVPVIGLVQVGTQAMADRYTYLPSVGVLIMTIWGAYELTRRWRYHAAGLSLAGAAAIIFCSR